jgi:hypothetical protein
MTSNLTQIEITQRNHHRAVRFFWCAGRRPVRGREEAMQYHQLRILCTLRDEVWDADKSLTSEQAMTLARERMARLGSRSRLFDIDG